MYQRFNQNDRWRQQHRNALLAWLPSQVVYSGRALNYVLLHGEDSLGTGWTPAWLPVNAAADFLRFLESEFTVQTGYDIFRELRRRAQAR